MSAVAVKRYWVEAEGIEPGKPIYRVHETVGIHEGKALTIHWQIGHATKEGAIREIERVNGGEYTAEPGCGARSYHHHGQYCEACGGVA